MIQKEGFTKTEKEGKIVVPAKLLSQIASSLTEEKSTSKKRVIL